MSSNTYIKRKHEIVTEPHFDGVTDKYVRIIENRTNDDVTVIDASGREVTYRGERRGDPNGLLEDFCLVVHEWRYGLSTVGMDIDPGDILTKNRTHPTLGIYTKTEVTHILLSSRHDGVYLDRTGIVVYYSKNRPAASKIQMLFSNKQNTLSDIKGHAIGIEILDPKSCLPVFYMNDGNVVGEITPTRHPIPEKEGVVIRVVDGTTGIITTTEHDLSEFTCGEGYRGIRIYTSYVDAKEDQRNPLRQKITKMAMEYDKLTQDAQRDKDRVKAFEYKRGWDDAIDNTKNEVNDKKKKLDEKEARISDRRLDVVTQIILTTLKLAGGGFALYKLTKGSK